MCGEHDRWKQVSVDPRSSVHDMTLPALHSGAGMLLSIDDRQASLLLIDRHLRYRPTAQTDGQTDTVQLHRSSPVEASGVNK